MAQKHKTKLPGDPKFISELAELDEYPTLAAIFLLLEWGVFWPVNIKEIN